MEGVAIVSAGNRLEVLGRERGCQRLLALGLCDSKECVGVINHQQECILRIRNVQVKVSSEIQNHPIKRQTFGHWPHPEGTQARSELSKHSLPVLPCAKP